MSAWHPLFRATVLRIQICKIISPAFGEPRDVLQLWDKLLGVGRKDDR